MEEMSWLAILLAAAVAGLIGMVIGNARGRPGAGAFWSVFLGPIGWLIVLLGPDERLKCPECAGVIESGVRRCRHCGADLMREQKRPSASEWPDPVDEYEAPPPRPVARVAPPSGPRVVSIKRRSTATVAWLLVLAATAFSQQMPIVVTASQASRSKGQRTVVALNDGSRFKDYSKAIGVKTDLYNPSPDPRRVRVEVAFVAKDTRDKGLRIFEAQTAEWDIAAGQRTNAVWTSRKIDSSAFRDIRFGTTMASGDDIAGYIVRVFEGAVLVGQDASGPAMQRVAEDRARFDVMVAEALGK